MCVNLYISAKEGEFASDAWAAFAEIALRRAKQIGGRIIEDSPTILDAPMRPPLAIAFSDYNAFEAYQVFVNSVQNRWESPLITQIEHRVHS